MVKQDNGGDKVTIETVYNLIDRKIGEVNASMIRLENKFDTLEAGRLTAVESKVANFEGRMMMVPILISVGISVFFFIMNYVLGQIKVK